MFTLIFIFFLINSSALKSEGLYCKDAVTQQGHWHGNANESLDQNGACNLLC